MRFTLHYRGDLYATRKTKHKHELRQKFHTQLKFLWSQKPLVEQTRLLDRQSDDCLLQRVGRFEFLPLVHNKTDSIAELSVTLLRPGAPGNLLAQGGDIDNRLKTLFDALSMPQKGGLPDGASPGADETPFFCLLQDDSLVTAVQVRTEQLLIEPTKSNSLLVDLSIFVRTRVTRNGIGNEFMSS